MEVISRAWYIGVICARCGLPIYCLEDKHEGKKPLRFSGPGIFRFICRSCSHEDLYRTSDIHILRAP